MNESSVEAILGGGAPCRIEGVSPARRNCGRPEVSESISRATGADGAAAGAATAAPLESTGVICAFGVSSSALETARRALPGRLSLSYVPDEFPVPDELLPVLLDELATVPSALESARRSLGRSSSPLDDELLFDDEFAVTSSEF